MKIFHLGKFDMNEYGGIEKVCFDIINHSPDFFENYFLFFGYKNSYEINNNIHKYSSKINLTISNQPLSLTFLINYIKILKHKPDIIHVHLPNYLSLFCLFFTPNNYLKKTIIHWHSDIIGKIKIFNLLSYLELRILNKVHTIIATSSDYANSSLILKKYFNKIKILPICINNTSSIYTNNNTYITILSVGRLVPYKGFDILINACSFISQPYKLIIVGSGPEYLNLNNLISSLSLNDKVFIYHNIDNFELDKLYKSSDIFCLPSKNRAEAYGLSMLQAISYGLSTISFEIPGSGLNYVNTKGIKVKNINHIVLYNSINFLINNPSIRMEIALRNYNYYNLNFNFDKYIESIVNLYKLI